MEQIMTILKNDRRISQMEYERNYIAIYDAIKQTISKVPSRHWYFLACPIIEKMNKTYDDVLELSEMYLAKVPKKTRIRKCQEILFGIKDLNQYVYTYWVISDGTNKIRSVPYKHRIALAQMVNKEVLYIIGVMRKLDAHFEFVDIREYSMKAFRDYDIESVIFLSKLQKLNRIFYIRAVRTSRRFKDEEVSLTLRYMRDAFSNAYNANNIYPENRKDYEKRKNYLSHAISDLYKLNRPLIKLFASTDYFSNDVREEISELVNDSTKLLQALQASDIQRFSNL